MRSWYVVWLCLVAGCGGVDAPSVPPLPDKQDVINTKLVKDDAAISHELAQQRGELDALHRDQKQQDAVNTSIAKNEGALRDELGQHREQLDDLHDAQSQQADNFLRAQQAITDLQRRVGIVEATAGEAKTAVDKNTEVIDKTGLRKLADLDEQVASATSVVSKFEALESRIKKGERALEIVQATGLEDMYSNKQRVFSYASLEAAFRQAFKEELAAGQKALGKVEGLESGQRILRSDLEKLSKEAQRRFVLWVDKRPGYQFVWDMVVKGIPGAAQPECYRWERGAGGIPTLQACCPVQVYNTACRQWCCQYAWMPAKLEAGRITISVIPGTKMNNGFISSFEAEGFPAPRFE